MKFSMQESLEVVRNNVIDSIPVFEVRIVCYEVL